MQILKELTEFSIKRDVSWKSMEILEHARKKTTQKVNLYEKVQIPEYHQSISRIKRFLEDEENLSKSAQKILKRRNKEKSAEA
jgi:V/A-type H+-transporting ATPase subunit D